MKKNHRHKWKKVMLTSTPFAKGSYMWWCKKCKARALTEECPAEKILEEKPEVTEEWIWKAIDYIKEYPTYHRLEEKLKEAGVEIKK